VPCPEGRRSILKSLTCRLSGLWTTLSRWSVGADSLVGSWLGGAYFVAARSPRPGAEGEDQPIGLTDGGSPVHERERSV